MANGLITKREKWDRLEAPLQQLDPLLHNVAKKHRLNLSKNHKIPERSLHRSKEIRHLLQIYLSSYEVPRYTLWICAFEQQDNKSKLKKEYILKDVKVDQIHLTALEQSLYLLFSWDRADLEWVS